MQQKLDDVSKVKERIIQVLRQKLASEQMEKEEQIAQLREQVRKLFHRLHYICLIIIKKKSDLAVQVRTDLEKWMREKEKVVSKFLYA